MPFSTKLPPERSIVKKLGTIARWEVSVAVLALLLVTVATGALYWISSYYTNRLPPNTIIANVTVSNLSAQEASVKLSSEAPIPENYVVSLYVDDVVVSSDSASIAMIDPYPNIIQEILEEYQHSNFITNGLAYLKQFFTSNVHTAQPMLEERSAQELIAVLANQVDIKGSEPAAELKFSKNPTSLVIHPGEPGRKVQTSETLARLNIAVASGEFSIPAVIASTSAPLTEVALLAARERATAMVGKSLEIQAGDDKVVYSDTDLLPLLAFPSGYSEQNLLNVISDLETKYNRPATAVEFAYDPQTLEVSSFIPPRNGLELDSTKALKDLRAKLQELERAGNTNPAMSSTTLQLEFAESPPKVGLAETNDLGITERIGVGNSEYHGSIFTRVHNVSITSERITNHIIKPGEEFSFNETLGEVSARTGFKPAYVIRAGRTELGDGGGVCQVSSTLFRALLDSGLDITRRLQHSYRVSYYELNSDPGFDATVYSGNVDLRFRNDTNNHVLIHIENDSTARKMRVELYGTSDGRRTEVSEYQKWGAVGAPPPEFILDPTLTAGQKVQIDWAVGGLKTKFKHTVYKANGDVLRENTYYSNYRPWSAKYRVGQL